MLVKSNMFCAATMTLLVFSWPAVSQNPPAISAQPPNFVVILADDLGYGDLNCYGHPSIRTPFLDRMASEGMRCTDFYSAAPVCTPSRAALLTGRLPIRTGMYGQKRSVLFPDSTSGLPASEITITQILKKKGYATACIGKWHLGHKPDFLPTRRGFDYYFGLPYSNDMKPTPMMRNEQVLEESTPLDKLTARYTEEALQFLKQKHDKPFFLYLAYNAPHVPHHSNPPFKGVSPRGTYGDIVEEVDWSVGEVLKTLHELKIADNTLVVFTSDNGPWLTKNQDGGSAGLLRDGKGSTWEGGMREPGIFWWPGRIKPGVSHCMTGTMDLLPTFLELAGVDLPTDRVLDGRSIAPVLLGNGEAKPAILFYYRNGKLMAARKGPWKLHLRTVCTYPKYDSKFEEQDPPLLFHLEQDPSEKYDVAKDHPDVVADLRAEIQRHQTEMKPGEPQMDFKEPKEPRETQ